MPYVDRETRNRIAVIEVNGNPETPGELNYRITEELLEYVKTRGLNYRTINDILGALEGAKLEFYRRVAVPYEETKIAANGDVYADPSA